MNYTNISEEKQGSHIDTVGDFFLNPNIQKAIQQYEDRLITIVCSKKSDVLKKYLLKYGPKRFISYGFGDLVRQIFSSDENLSEFLLMLREDSFQNKEIITFILSCEQIRRNIEVTPCSISEIFSQRILHIIETLGQEKYPNSPNPPGFNEGEDEYIENYEGNSDEDLYWTYMDGLYKLKDKGFPMISKSGVLVYFYDSTQNPEIIFVWNNRLGIVKYNKNGEIQTEVSVEGQKKPLKRVMPSHLRLVEPLATE